ncbi:hypothetical protein RchiOBHm_Chr2g0152601 [Rosa chinensis]|uniref:Uncharacterized protein n=1 Tax=Rosa chinensis TaxID=74649 RepID=A0A2P6S0H7_ROSCH|nr:hypothetical protein RchiOBHm_Chr2g0152601 [Rosa chinensis]
MTDVEMVERQQIYAGLCCIKKIQHNLCCIKKIETTETNDHLLFLPSSNNRKVEFKELLDNRNSKWLICCFYQLQTTELCCCIRNQSTYNCRCSSNQTTEASIKLNISSIKRQKQQKLRHLTLTTSTVIF